MWWWALVGCATSEVADTGATEACATACAEGFAMDGLGACRLSIDPRLVACAAGYLLRFDGVCVEDVAPPTLDDALAALPCSGLGTPGDRLDLDEGCADEFCVGARFGDVEHLLDPPDEYYSTCEPVSDDTIGCRAGAVAIEIDDVPTGAAMPPPDARIAAVHVWGGWYGRDEIGFGLGASQGCLLAARRDAVDVRLHPDVLGRLTPFRAAWEDFHTRSVGEWASTSDRVESLSIQPIERHWEDPWH